MDELIFQVYGVAEPKGSTRSFYVKKVNRVVTTSSNKNLKGWEQRVATEAQRLTVGYPWFEGSERIGYDISITFVMPRPKSIPKKQTLLVKRPDLDKLARAVLDGLTNVVFPDDAQVVHIDAAKRYCNADEAPHASIKVKKVREEARP